MKFTLIKDLRQDKSMRPILIGLLVFTLVYLLSNLLVKYYNFGILPDAVSLSLFGNEDEYIDPLTTAVFLEFWHMEIFFMMMVLLTLSAVYIRMAKESHFRTLTLNLLMVPALLSLTALLLSYFFSSNFVYLYSFTFVLWHITALYMITYSLFKLYNEPNL